MEAYLDTSEFLPDFIVRMSTVRTRMDKYIAQVKRCVVKSSSVSFYYFYIVAIFAFRGLRGSVKSMVPGFF